jgi:hypothetical protein
MFSLGAMASRIGRPSPPGSGIRTSSPRWSTFSPANTCRMTVSVSRILVTGRANGTPCSPSITCGPELPNPNRNRPSLSSARVSAVIAIAVGVLVPNWRTPEPSSTRLVRAAR